jgi:branched-chain amino acid transport system ATP-binding protein
MSFLELERISAGYGRLVAVRDVSITADTGGLTAVFGHNGAGKTTLLKVAAGVLSPIGGHVSVEGRQITARRHRGRPRSVAMVRQGSGVFARLSVEENVKLGFVAGEKTSRAEQRQRLETVEKFLPVVMQRWKDRAGELSGGQRQMVSIARALVTGATMLLLDEPSVGLAPKLVEEMMSAFSSLRDGGLGIVLVEQNVQQALTVADTVSVMKSGRLILSAPAEELRARESLWDLF